MNHPDALLAEYVDGALAQGERAVVERHLDACERCREEVALARTARSALASVTEAPAPGDLGDAAIAEARRRAAGAPAAAPPSGRPGWYRWAGAAAGIAAALLLLTLVLPHVGTEPAREVAGGAVAKSAAAPPATTVEAQNINYDLAGVEALATSSGGQEGAAFGQNTQPTQVPVAASVTLLDCASCCIAPRASFTSATMSVASFSSGNAPASDNASVRRSPTRRARTRVSSRSSSICRSSRG